MLRTLVLEAIRSVSGFVKDDEERFVQLVRESHDLQSADTVKSQKKQLAKFQKRCSELDALIKRLYEDKVSGELSAKRFEILSREYEQEQEELERQVAELREAISAFTDDSNNADRFVNMARRYTEISELNATILNEYIDKIVVFEADKSSGRREQRVDIYFSFIGKFEIPGQDVGSEPFDKAEHRKAQYRAYYYRHREKILAEKAKQRADAKIEKSA